MRNILYHLRDLEQMVNVILRDDLAAYKSLNLTKQKMHAMIDVFEMVLNENVGGYRFKLDNHPYNTNFVENAILVGYDASLPLNLMLVTSLGATKILKFELDKLLKSTRNELTLSQKKTVFGILRETEIIPDLYRNKSTKKLTVGEAKRKNVLDVIVKSLPSGYVILDAIEYFLRESIRYSNFDRTIVKPISKISLRRVNNLVNAYLSRIGSRQRGFTYSLIEDTVDKMRLMFPSLNVSPLKKSIAMSHNRNVRRTTARFALNRHGLPSDAIQKILYHANLSNVNANTPGSSNSRAQNLARNGKYIRRIINEMTNTRKRKRNGG